MTLHVSRPPSGAVAALRLAGSDDVTIRLRRPAVALSADRPAKKASVSRRATTALGIVLAIAAAPAVWLGLPWLAPDARIALGIFALALIGWVLLDLDDALVALAAAAALAVSGTVDSDVFYRALGDELVWLLVAAFIIGGALKACDLTGRLAALILNRVQTVAGLFRGLTLFIVATALVVPSTSGRASVLLPVLLSLAAAIRDARIVRALALLFPTIILLSAGGSLIGAGAHLIALEAIGRLNGPELGYLDWIAIGMPLALITSLAASSLILRLFLSSGQRRAELSLDLPAAGPLTPSQLYVLGIVLIVIGSWLSEPVHGVEMAIVAVGGAVALAVKPLSGISLKDALKSVEWSLLLFLAATLVITSALIETDAALRIAKVALREVKPFIRENEALAALAVATIAVLSHLLIPSRSARAAILVPTVALPMASIGLNPTAFVLIAVMGTGFCQTFASSAKPLAIFGQLDVPTYTKGDLVRLSLALMPLVLGLILVFALFVWPHQGLPLARAG